MSVWLLIVFCDLIKEGDMLFCCLLEECPSFSFGMVKTVSISLLS